MSSIFIVIIYKMNKEYSFKDSSRLVLGNYEYEKNNQASQYSSDKMSNAWADLRVEQIKKKYQSPAYNLRKSHEISSNSEKQQQRNPRFSSSKTIDSGICSKSKLGNGYAYKLNKKEYTQQGQLDRNKQIYDDENVPSFGIQPKQTSSFGLSSKYIQSAKANKSSLHRPELRQIHNTKSYNQQAIDPRVKNIDKINMKIKKILECLQENENFIKNQKSDVRKSFARQEVLSRGEHSQEFEETQILSRQKIGDKKNNISLESPADFTKQLFNSKQKFNQDSRYRLRDSTPNHSNYKFGYQLQKQGTTSANPAMDNYKPDLLIDNSRARDTTVSSFLHRNDNSSLHGNDNSLFHRKNSSFIHRNDISSIHKSDNFQKSTNWKEDKKDAMDRSKSCLGGFKKQDEFQLGGKRFDEQITKINQRIRQSQQEKKRLNIEFKPYSFELKKNCSTSTLAQKSLRNANNRPPLPKSRLSELGHKYQKSQLSYNARIKTEEQIQAKISQYQKRIQQRSNMRESFTEGQAGENCKFQNEVNQKVKQVQQTDNLFVRNPSFKGDINQCLRASPNKSQHASPQQNNSYNQQNNQKTSLLRHKTQQGIQNRRMKLLDVATATFARETKRLIQKLSEQVKFDEQFRNSKIWFRDQVNKNKWTELQHQLAKYNDYNVQSELNYEFEVTEEEDNPFFSARQNPSSTQQVVMHWRRSQDHWNKYIRHQFDLEQFQRQKFKCDKMDLQKKGYFSVEDLVRFLNMETGAFHRIRDLILVFKRLTIGKKIDWKSFLAVLDHKNQK